MSLKDRTTEFKGITESLKARQLSFVEPRKPSLSQPSTFMAQASVIAKEIGVVSGKLEKLAKLAKSKSLFDDRPVEIEELTHIIKQDMVALNHKIVALEQFQKQSQAEHHLSKQSAENETKIIGSLQTRLNNTVNRFKDVLEIRTKNMREQKDRREQFTASVAVPSNPTVYYPTSSTSGTGYHQLALIEQQDTSYMHERSNAVEGIQSAINELGQMFRQLTHLVAEQGESVQRIDMHIEDVSTNVTRGQEQLLQYLNTISSNRSLMIKIFSLIILFIFIFFLFS